MPRFNDKDLLDKNSNWRLIAAENKKKSNSVGLFLTHSLIQQNGYAIFDPIAAFGVNTPNGITAYERTLRYTQNIYIDYRFFSDAERLAIENQFCKFRPHQQNFLLSCQIAQRFGHTINLNNEYGWHEIGSIYLAFEKARCPQFSHLLWLYWQHRINKENHQRFYGNNKSTVSEAPRLFNAYQKL